MELTDSNSSVCERPIIALLVKEPRIETLPLAFNSDWTDEAKLELMRCFLRDLFAFLSFVEGKANYQVLVCCEGGDQQEAPFIDEIVRTHGFDCLRIDAAERPRIFGVVQERVFRSFAPSFLFVMDLYTPVFPEQYLEMGKRSLSGSDVVFGPDPFGQFYLVGLRRPLDLFGTLDWHDPEYLRTLVGQCQQAGLKTKLLPLWYSVKTADDMAFLCEHLNVKVANKTLKESATLKLLESR